MNHAFSLDEDWQTVLARIAEPSALDASARAHGALVRRREVRDGATLLRLGLGYGPGGMSLREAAAWAATQGIAGLSDVALLKRLRGAADWFGVLAAQVLADRAGVAGDMGAGHCVWWMARQSAPLAVTAPIGVCMSLMTPAPSGLPISS
jgi:hypothetical protein